MIRKTGLILLSKLSKDGIVQKAVNRNDQENWFNSSFQTFKGNIRLETDIKHNYIPGSQKLIIWTLLFQTQGNNSTISNKIW